MLVVEDEWVIADQIATALAEGGYEVVGPVRHAREALRFLGGGAIDAALLDINLDGDRSFDLAARLASASIPFAFLSGYSAQDLPRQFAIAPLVQKPVDDLTVRSCVAELLRSSARGPDDAAASPPSIF